MLAKPVLSPATINASVEVPTNLTLFIEPTSIVASEPRSFISPPPKDIEASVEDISISEAEISNSLVAIATSVPSNFTKLPVPSPE